MSDSALMEVLQAGDLVDVRILSFAGRMATQREDLADDDVEQDFQAMVGQREGIIEVRVNANVRVRAAEYMVEAATQFHHSPELTVSEETAREFAEHVGVMAIYPYLREAIQDASARLRQRVLVLPLLRAGELTLSQSDDDGQATAAE